VEERNSRPFLVSMAGRSRVRRIASGLLESIYINYLAVVQFSECVRAQYLTHGSRLLWPTHACNARQLTSRSRHACDRSPLSLRDCRPSLLFDEVPNRVGSKVIYSVVNPSIMHPCVALISLAGLVLVNYKKRWEADVIVLENGGIIYVIIDGAATVADRVEHELAAGAVTKEVANHLMHPRPADEVSTRTPLEPRFVQAPIEHLRLLDLPDVPVVDPVGLPKNVLKLHTVPRDVLLAQSCD
jgi:hypothetical protein